MRGKPLLVGAYIIFAAIAAVIAFKQLKPLFDRSDVQYAAWFQGVVALASLGSVILIFLRSARDRRQDQEERAALTRAQVQNFWVQQLVLEPYLSEVHSFFDRYYKFIKSEPQRSALLLPEAKRDEIERLNSAVDHLLNRLIYPLMAVSKSFGILATFLNEINDVVAETIGDKEPPALKILIEREKRFECTRTAFITGLLSAHLDLVKLSHLKGPER